jgi:hypothetical protein
VAIPHRRLRNQIAFHITFRVFNLGHAGAALAVLLNKQYMLAFR